MGENILYKIYEWYISRDLKPEKMPKHIAIIMDGNRRFSKLQGNIDVVKGHEIGVDTLEKVLDWSIELGIEIITAYAFQQKISIELRKNIRFADSCLKTEIIHMCIKKDRLRRSYGI